MKFIKDLLDERLRVEPRDEDGLTAKQRKFFGHRQDSMSDKQALDKASLSLADLLRWQSEESFREAYTLLVPRTSYEDVKRALDAMAPDAILLMARAVAGEELNKSQRWVVDKVLKAYGFERLSIETVTTHVPFEARLALSMAERGMALPPAMRDLFLRHYPQAAHLALPAAEVVEVEDLSSPIYHTTEDTEAQT